MFVAHEVLGGFGWLLVLSSVTFLYMGLFPRSKRPGPFTPLSDWLDDNRRNLLVMLAAGLACWLLAVIAGALAS